MNNHQLAAELYGKLQQSFGKREDLAIIQSAIEKAREIGFMEAAAIAVSEASRAAHASEQLSKGTVIAAKARAKIQASRAWRHRTDPSRSK